MAVSGFRTRQGHVPHDVKFIGDLAGSYLLSSRESYESDQARVFGCRARSLTVQMAVLAAPVAGAVGEMLALKLDDIGLIKASVARITSDGFAADLHVPEKDIAAMAARIDWLKQRRVHAIADRRLAKRWQPRNPRSLMIVGDRRDVPCFIIDLSTSGAALSADTMPQMGQPVVVGGVIGRVVRRLEAGFAIQFLTPLAADQVETLVAPMPEGKRDALYHALAMAETGAGEAPAA